MSELAEILGERLKGIRKRMNLSRAEFADKIELSEDALGLIERGETAPRLENLQKIASFLDMSVSELLEFDNKPASTPSGQKIKGKSIQNFIIYLKTKSPEQIRMLHDVAKNIFDKKR